MFDHSLVRFKANDLWVGLPIFINNIKKSDLCSHVKFHMSSYMIVLSTRIILYIHPLKNSTPSVYAYLDSAILLSRKIYNGGQTTVVKYYQSP